MRQSYAEGQVVEGFRLLRRLHQGGMGSLWAVEREEPATAPPDEGPLAMKIPSLAEGEDVSAIVGFEVEQLILPRLSGPHVPRFVAAGDFSRLPFLVMERVEGRSLVGDVEAAPLPPDRVVETGLRLARALQDLHRQRVLHLDLKPSNVMIRPDGSAVLLDFGLSRHDDLPDLLAEESDVPMGTGAYISPEQIVGDRGDRRSDIFALGVMLYELVTGKLPFGSPQGRGGMLKRLWRDPVPPRRHAPDCPEWLQEVILRCLEIDPEKRYATPAQLAFALQHPEQVALTERARRTQQDGVLVTLKRWLRSRRVERRLRPAVVQHLSTAPIVMAAVDLSNGVDPLADVLRVHARRALDADPDARLACVTVLKTAILAVESTGEGAGNPYVQRLVELKEWARPLADGDDRVSYHVLEAVDPASALIEYAHHNSVDHIVVGARASSALRRYLGSVSAQVVAEAPCTVTVVRLPA
ncbi:protein kinase domain-containing protein [Alsobacter sp. R-9]